MMLIYGLFSARRFILFNMCRVTYKGWDLRDNIKVCLLFIASAFKMY